MNARTRFFIMISLAFVTAGAGLYAALSTRSALPRELKCAECNLIVISLSNLRRAHLPSYGYKRMTAPHITEFFKNSFRLGNGLAPASLTYTDSISLFYSLQPYTHRLMDRSAQAESAPVLMRHRSLPEQLREAGYETAAFVSDEDYAFENGLGRIFGQYFDRSSYPQWGIDFKPWSYNVGTKDLIDPLLDWIAHRQGKKFFAFLQAYDMHCPYTPGPGFSERFDARPARFDRGDCYMTLSPAKLTKDSTGQPALELESWYGLLGQKPRSVLFNASDVEKLKALYDEELLQADANLGKLFEVLESTGRLRDTVVILMSEHGDYLGENGYFMKASLEGGGNLHNANLGFAFMMRAPGLTRPWDYPKPVQLVDIMPFLLHVLDVPLPEGLEGRSPLVQPARDYAFSGSTRERAERKVRLEAVQDRVWKLTREEELLPIARPPKLKLVRLDQDPEEERDVLGQFPEVARRLDTALENWRKGFGDAP